MTYYVQSPHAPPTLQRSYSTDSNQSPLHHKRSSADAYLPSDMQSQLELLRAIKQRNHQLRCMLEEMQPMQAPGADGHYSHEHYTAQLNQPEELPEDLKAIFLSYFPVGHNAAAVPII
ncbi:hypothetical protein SPRG_03379 [Saprolegnia parasitica CBS 223.65]|uniref:Uncharacterized protein n=1 Tax=Saprolegnia parasitica (strain CBS 223.65) TaxID=695850 RepID=A0A067CZF1_SAPPC|nr:hypothetical protein SPRG_03379 [Saprolegnia parasitica CBS 223.65]KDO32162.1 hypothetical protein SPRG_03379 [Saprolegnia parasitica CBS 223.65]|eukprot:XP_012197346.1 hypothetical protein SPRG_03379 [Saprolegnia parasitica CBS 223.65]